MTQPQPDPLNTTEAKANPRVEAAFRSVANATVQLHLAVAAFGIGRPGESVMPLVPALLDEALQEGLSRVTVRQAPATSWPALLARVRELGAELRRERAAHSSTIDDRDRAAYYADQLAAAVAPIDVRGEHSAGNCPWIAALAHAAEMKRAQDGPQAAV
jgi:hypothetical protein